MDHKNSTGISENLRKLSIHSFHSHIPNFNRHSIINEIDEIDETEEGEESNDVQKENGSEKNRKKSIFQNNDMLRKVDLS